MPKKKITKKEFLPEPQQEETTESKVTSKTQDKQFYYVIGAMVGLIVLFLLAHSFFQSLKTFEYQGLEFSKEKFGDIPLYYYYYYTNPSYATGNVIQNEPRMINLYLRHDPRTNEIPVDGNLEFQRGKFIYITLNSTGLTECPYSTLALAGLSSFFGQNGFEIKGGVPDEAEAKKDNLEYITCEQHPDNSVILIKSGDETKIKRDSKTVYTAVDGKLAGKSTEYSNCYTITVANCEILQATEKFMTQSIIDAKARI